MNRSIKRFLFLSDCLVSNLGHSLGETYLFREMQSVYSTAPTDLPNNYMDSNIPIQY